MKCIMFILVLISLPSVAISECVEFKTVEHENGIEVVCIGKELTPAEKVKSEAQSITETGRSVENYYNEQAQKKYEQCQALLPEVKTADDYKRMEIGDLFADKLARKSAMARLEAMGCIPRGAGADASVKAPKYISCTSVGSFTNCSDGTSYNRVGGTLIGSNGTNCSIIGSTMNCSR